MNNSLGTPLNYHQSNQRQWARRFKYVRALCCTCALIERAVAAGGGGRGGGGGGICPRAPVEGGRRQDVNLKKILRCLTKINKF